MKKKHYCKFNVIILSVILTASFVLTGCNNNQTVSTASAKPTAPKISQNNVLEDLYPEFDIISGALKFHFPANTAVKLPEENKTAIHLRNKEGLITAYVEFQALEFDATNFILAEYDKNPNPFYQQVEASLFPAQGSTPTGAYFKKNGEPEDISVQNHPGRIYPIILVNDGNTADESKELQGYVISFINNNFIHTIVLAANPGLEQHLPDAKAQFLANLANATTK